MSPCSNYVSTPENGREERRKKGGKNEKSGAEVKIHFHSPPRSRWFEVRGGSTQDNRQKEGEKTEGG